MSKPMQLNLPFSEDDVKANMQEAPVDPSEHEARLPKPVGFRLLVMIPEVEETFQGSALLKASKTQQNDLLLSFMGVVVDMGELAYKDDSRFPEGAWCQPGDVVLFRMNTGTRFKVDGIEYRLMNDDSIEAVVPDPKAITRVMV